MTRDDPRRTPWPPLPRMVLSSTEPPDPPPGPSWQAPTDRACQACGAGVPDGFKVCRCGNRCGALPRPAVTDRAPPPPVDRLWLSDGPGHVEMVERIDGELGFVPLGRWWGSLAVRPGDLLDNIRLDGEAHRAGEAP